MTQRVAFVSSHAAAGGSERYLELLLEELGPEWIGGVVALDTGPLIDRLRSGGVDVRIVPTGTRAGLLTGAVRVRRELKDIAPDVVHANGVKAALVSCLATVGHTCPVVWVKHDFSWDGWLTRLIAWRSARIVSVARATTSTFGSQLSERIQVVPNGLPPDVRCDPAGRTVVGEIVGSEQAPVVALFGRLHPAKGQLQLVEAIPRILERHPETQFLFVGADDPTELAYAKKVMLVVERLGIKASVTFTGHRADALTLMSGSDIVVVPSMPDGRGGGREACAFVLLEAMAVGTSVVGHASGGIPEVVGNCGRLVEEGNIDALADAILDLIDDPDGQRKLEACGIARVRSQFALATTVAAMRAIYRDVAGSR